MLDVLTLMLAVSYVYGYCIVYGYGTKKESRLLSKIDWSIPSKVVQSYGQKRFHWVSI